jgi:hypothetical protein
MIVVLMNFVTMKYLTEFKFPKAYLIHLKHNDKINEYDKIKLDENTVENLRNEIIRLFYDRLSKYLEPDEILHLNNKHKNDYIHKCVENYLHTKTKEDLIKFIQLNGEDEYQEAFRRCFFNHRYKFIRNLFDPYNTEAVDKYFHFMIVCSILCYKICISGPL